MTERQGVDAALFHELLISTLFDGVVSPRLRRGDRRERPIRRGS